MKIMINNILCVSICWTQDVILGSKERTSLIWNEGLVLGSTAVKIVPANVVTYSSALYYYC